MSYVAKMVKRNLLLISSSRVHGYGYLESAETEINDLLKQNNVKTVLFIPYALKDHDKYFQTVQKPFNEFGFGIESIHNYESPLEAVQKAQAIFIGGGNTFRLLNTLYKYNLVEAIRKVVLEKGIPYIGSSAGTNVATRSIHTTNDMPIIFPPSFEGLKLVPFNINPHYLDPEPSSKHKGETREERILQYFEEEDSADVVLALREGNCLWVKDNYAVLKGICNARLFYKGKKAEELKPETVLSHLLEV